MYKAFPGEARNLYTGRQKEMARDFKNPQMKTVWEYGLITVSMMIMTIGVYFFKFPNHFAFGGVTGFSTVVSELTRWSASQFTFIANKVGS